MDMNSVLSKEPSGTMTSVVLHPEMEHIHTYRERERERETERQTDRQTDLPSHSTYYKYAYEQENQLTTMYLTRY